MLKRALFLDRDGVINKAIIKNGKSYPPSSLEELVILDGVKEALILSKEMGFYNIVVTNQPDIATGKTTKDVVNEINSFLLSRLRIDDIFLCPHIDADSCLCRKPKPGMFYEAQKKWGIDLKKSFLIGDRWRDIEAGQDVKNECYFIDYGYDERRPQPPFKVVSSLLEAVHDIETQA